MVNVENEINPQEDIVIQEPKENFLKDYKQNDVEHFSTPLELSMLITTIFRSDRFDDVSIKENEKNGVMNMIFDRLKSLLD